jgi:hypothetical protein
MSRRSLRPQLNQIRAWVRQGRTDAWIGHQLEATVQQIQAFKREHGLELDADGEPDGRETPEQEIDLRAEDDALIAAELEAAAEAAEAAAEDEPDDAVEEDAEDADAEPATTRTRSRRRRSRRGGRRTAGSSTLEATFDHGEEGYGLWLDPAVQDDPVYAEHWAGHRPVEVTIEEDQIVIRRAGGGDEDDD